MKQKLEVEVDFVPGDRVRIRPNTPGTVTGVLVGVSHQSMYRVEWHDECHTRVELCLAWRLSKETDPA